MSKIKVQVKNSETGQLRSFSSITGAVRMLTSYSYKSRVTMDRAKLLLADANWSIVENGQQAPTQNEATTQPKAETQNNAPKDIPTPKAFDRLPSKESYKEEVKEATLKTKGGDDKAGKVLADMVTPFLDLDVANIDEKINLKVIEALATHTKTLIIEDKKTGEKRDVGAVHSEFSKAVIFLNRRKHIFLTGAAGSGKSFAAKQLSKALKLDFYSISVSIQTPITAFLGYMDATGKYVRTQYREAYEKGGVFLLDEMDNGNPNILTILNGSLEADYCAFADGQIKRHKDFVCVAGGNTFGGGANSRYVGRLKFDAAFKERFNYITWNYDEALEKTFVAKGFEYWHEFILGCRRNQEKHNLEIVVSPRAVINGQIALADGLPLEFVKESVLFKGLHKDEKAKLTQGL